MRALVVAFLAACGSPAGPAVRTSPRLAAPPVLDPSRPAAAYLSSVALQLQPGWGQFLDDCRLRLPSDHPLNHSRLATLVELTLDRTGKVVAIQEITPSGNADFDKAARDVIAEAALPAPPVDVWSDDDRVYLRWLFARDRRQAGPATAELEHRQLPLPTALDRFIAAHDLGRAARRITDANESAITTVMTAALREALGSVDGSVQRAAVETVAAAKVVSLVPSLRPLLDSSDDELRLAVIAAAGELEDGAVADALLRRLPGDLTEHKKLALADVATLVKLNRATEVRAAIERAVPSPIALEAFRFVPGSRDVVERAVGQGSANQRGAACAGLAGSHSAALAKGLRDADASVRAACVAAVTDNVAGLAALQGDRDAGVRANAILAVARVDPKKLANGADDRVAEVRAAYATALGHAGGEAQLRPLLDDRDPKVRAAAWASYALRGVTPATSGLGDPSSDVRLAAIATSHDRDSLQRLAASDESTAVRTAALVALVHQAGRAALAPSLLATFAAAAPASADRVRIARAWLLAP